MVEEKPMITTFIFTYHHLKSKKDIYLVTGKMYIEDAGGLNKNQGTRDNGIEHSFKCVMIANEGDKRSVILKRNKSRFLQMASESYSEKALTTALKEKKLKVSELILVKKIGRTVYELE